MRRKDRKKDVRVQRRCTQKNDSRRGESAGRQIEHIVLEVPHGFYCPHLQHYTNTGSCRALAWRDSGIGTAHDFPTRQS